MTNTYTANTNTTTAVDTIIESIINVLIDNTYHYSNTLGIRYDHVQMRNIYLALIRTFSNHGEIIINIGGRNIERIDLSWYEREYNPYIMESLNKLKDIISSYHMWYEDIYMQEGIGFCCSLSCKESDFCSLQLIEED